MLATAGGTCAGSAASPLAAVVMMPTPSGLVSARRSPGRAPPLVRMRWGCTSPMTASPYFGSLSSTVWPPASAAPPSSTFSAPPRRISEMISSGSLGGNPQMFSASTTSPPMA